MSNEELIADSLQRAAQVESKKPAIPKVGDRVRLFGGGPATGEVVEVYEVRTPTDPSYAVVRMDSGEPRLQPVSLSQLQIIEKGLDEDE